MKDYPARPGFPCEESKFPWLSMLLDAYAIIDSGVALAIDEQEAKRSVKLACKEGCDNCCMQKDIPVYPLELVGIYWFSTEKIVPPVRKTLKEQLSQHEKSDPCPFLMDNSCSIRPIRPVSCRQFNVLGRPCDTGEDPYYSRRGDVLTPLEEYTERAFSAMMPFYGVSGEAVSDRAVIDSIIHAQAGNIQTYDWKNLARIMDNFDSKNI
ncbi:MAG: YkgJ family cysteine cluster protein [Thermodesulfovibrionales bacterium]|nr:YkgJ family cysteine cluster protein [Thermodesulfovibrionales bacterium]